MKSTLAALVGTAFVFPLFANDWPQWRGPNHSGEAPGATPPVEWSETTNVKWKRELPGFGNASPIIWKDRIFIASAVTADAPAAASVAPSPGPPPAEPGPGQGEGRRGRRGGGFRSEVPTAKVQFKLMALN